MTEQSPFIWHELVTPDQRASGHLFRELLHWTSREVDAGPFGSHTFLAIRSLSGNRVTRNLIRNGFIIAGLMNIAGVLLFSRLFTNTAINEADPVVMSNFGLVMIAVWGLAYLGAATTVASVKWLAAVFAVEKLAYVLVWAMWHSKNSLSELFTKDLFAGVFYSIYGLNDLLFMSFFAWVFYFQTSSREA